jgi:hypothetical protein
MYASSCPVMGEGKLFIMKLKLLSIVLVLSSLSVIILADAGKLPYLLYILNDVPFGDKLGHLILMGSLSFVLNWTALDSHSGPEFAAVIWRVSLILIVLTTVEELTQQFFPSRTLSALDLVFSYSGVAVGGRMVFRMKTQKTFDSE